MSGLDPHRSSISRTFNQKGTCPIPGSVHCRRRAGLLLTVCLAVLYMALPAWRAQAQQFLPHVDYAVPTGPQFVAIGDFNGDGKLDLAVVGVFENVSILMGNGDGTFQPYVNYIAGSVPRCIAAGDFNGDGKLDLVISNSRAIT
jgi:hypothetical protein